ncbi:MAG: hypothetical protein M1457_04130 [bacterium]|nr:hypothetical protein [bacterium]
MALPWYQKAGNQPALIGTIGTIIGAILTAVAFIYSDRFLQAPGLRDKIEMLKSQVMEKNNRISTLETQLVPFRTIALEKYTGDENQRMKKLASALFDLENDVDIIKRYSDVAKMNALGMDVEVVPPLQYNSPISTLLMGTWQSIEGRLVMSKTIEAEKKYRKIVDKYPHFPFSYYYISDCLKERGDPSWKDYAHKAIDILEKTTSITGHHHNHDEMLQYLKKELQVN